MSIYTRTGDKGTTALFGGKRVSKADLQIEAYGTIDELSSYIGLVNSKSTQNKSQLLLTDIQKDLYKIMGYLAGAKLDLNFLPERVEYFEKRIDEIDKMLPRLSRFILPGGTVRSSWLHILRVVCRRSERAVVRYFAKLKADNQQLMTIKYLNRLSDLFFTLARLHNKGKDHFA